MVSLISKTDVELELQATLPITYSTATIEGFSDEAEDTVQVATNRTTFTGPSASVYKRAVLLSVCMRIGASLPSLIQGNISSISEQGSSISFRSGDGFQTEYYTLIRRLLLKPATAKINVTTNDETFYRPQRRRTTNDP